MIENQIINRNAVPPEYMQLAMNIWPMVEGWLTDRYQLKEGFFNDLQIQLEMKPGRNWYYKDPKVALIRVASTRLWLYNIKEAKFTTPPEGLDVGVGVYLASSTVHEATHYIQYTTGNPKSEIETTQNQIDFMEEWNGLYYTLLVPATGQEIKEVVEEV